MLQETSQSQSHLIPLCLCPIFIAIKYIFLIMTCTLLVFCPNIFKVDIDKKNIIDKNFFPSFNVQIPGTNLSLKCRFIFENLPFNVRPLGKHVNLIFLFYFFIFQSVRFHSNCFFLFQSARFHSKVYTHTHSHTMYLFYIKNSSTSSIHTIYVKLIKI